jgi:hypothetical protein
MTDFPRHDEIVARIREREAADMFGFERTESLVGARGKPYADHSAALTSSLRNSLAWSKPFGIQH